MVTADGLNCCKQGWVLL